MEESLSSIGYNDKSDSVTILFKSILALHIPLDVINSIIGLPIYEHMVYHKIMKTIYGRLQIHF